MRPSGRLGLANQDKSSAAWDSIAVAALSTCLAGLFPSSLCAMYGATTAERKLAAGIPARHHWPSGCVPRAAAAAPSSPPPLRRPWAL